MVLVETTTNLFLSILHWATDLNILHVTLEGVSDLPAAGSLQHGKPLLHTCHCSSWQRICIYGFRFRGSYWSALKCYHLQAAVLSLCQRLLLLQQRQLNGWHIMCTAHVLALWFQLTLVTIWTTSVGDRTPCPTSHAGHICSASVASKFSQMMVKSHRY